MADGHFEGTTRYRVVRRLAVGSYGVVYEAFDRLQGRPVALKTLPRLPESMVPGIQAEFLALAGIVHPNLVRLHELVTEQRPWFVAMELVDGEDLAAAAKRTGRDGPRLRTWLTQLAEGLCAIHEAGRLHRDLALDHVRVTTTDRVVLLGFGLVADAEPGREGLIYSAPERVEAGTMTAASDWYAFGVILFELLTGQPPFSGEPGPLLNDKTTRDAPLARRVAPTVPTDLAELCRRLLFRLPDARPTGPEVLRRLTQAAPPAVELAPAPVNPGLVGRVDELAILREGLAQAKRGRSAMVRVVGAPGIGKTALLQAFLRYAHAHRALATTCSPASERPFASVAPLVHQLVAFANDIDATEALRTLALSFPEVLRSPHVRRGAPPPELVPQARWIAVCRALRAALVGAATSGPLVLAVDDAHWADPDSARLLRAVIESPLDGALLVCIHPPRSDVPTWWPAERNWAWSRVVALEPLDATSAQQLADAWRQPSSADSELELTQRIAVGEPPAPTRAASIVAGGGHPLSIRLAAADEEMPARSVRERLQARWRRSPKVDRTLTATVVLAESPLGLGFANRVAGLQADDRAVVDRLVTEGWLRFDSGRPPSLVPAHSTVRYAVQAGLSDQDQRRLHGAIADALLSGPESDPARVSRHLEAAGRIEAAAKAAQAGADRSMGAQAFLRAADRYEAVVRLGGDGPRWQLQAQLAEALFVSGRPSCAAETYRAGGHDAPARVAFEMFRRAAELDFAFGDEARGLATLKALLRQVGLTYPETPREAARAAMKIQAAISRFSAASGAAVAPDDEAQMRMDLCGTLASSLLSLDPNRASYFATSMLQSALRYAASASLARALTLVVLLGPALGLQDDRAPKDALVRLSVRWPRARGSAHLARAASAARLGNWPEADAQATAALTAFDQDGVEIVERCVARRLLTEARAAQGDWTGLRAILAEAEREADALSHRALAINARRSIEACLSLLALDEPERARTAMTHSGSPTRAEWRDEDVHGVVGAVLCDLYEGRRKDAFRRWMDAWPRIERSALMLTPSRAVQLYWLSARVTLASGHDGAVSQVLKTNKKIGGLRMLHTGAVVALLRAEVAIRRGRSEDARGQYATAMTAFSAAHMPAVAAACRMRQGELTAGEEGRWLVQQGERTLANAGILRPEAFIRLYSSVTTE